MPEERKVMLLSCPCCGGRPDWEYRDWNERDETGDDGTGWIECLTCHIRTPITDLDDATEIWNRRA